MTTDSGNGTKSVTIDRNGWSRCAGTSGHDSPEWAVTLGRNTQIAISKLILSLVASYWWSVFWRSIPIALAPANEQSIASSRLQTPHILINVLIIFSQEEKLQVDASNKTRKTIAAMCSSFADSTLWI
ncbi:MAG: hypothetical protein P4L91_20965 [Burkholderiaceae bacterium]|nr:hypothetical protein [Burkholderiaceae bacterium]